MAVPTNIKTLLAGSAVEWARIEFKETWDAEASLKMICAFANDIPEDPQCAGAQWFPGADL